MQKTESSGRSESSPWLPRACSELRQLPTVRTRSLFPLLGFVLWNMTAVPAMAQSGVRTYPDPGHRWLGVYAGGPERHFDYFLRKISLGDEFAGKAAWWADLKDARTAEKDAHQHDVYVVYCGERESDIEAATGRLDAWLKPEPDCPTYPELIPAICLGEENVGSQSDVLDALARHVRDKYGIPVFQWYSDPLAPNPNLTADGWIWDSYGWDAVRFRKHVMKFVVLRQPAICVPWAADPHWPHWTQYPTASALIDREWRQMDICREFNVSCAVFAVAGPHGSVNTWAGSRAPELEILRNALQTRREAMHALRPGELPQTSADFSARDRTVDVGGDSAQPSEFVESFSSFDWLHDADVRGFLDLKLSSQPDEPGTLSLIPRASRPASASLTYRFESYFPLQSVEMTLDAAAPAGVRNTLALTIDDTDDVWPLEVVQQDSDRVEALVLSDERVVEGHHVFFVRVTMENPNGKTDEPGNFIDQLRVRCIHQTPPAGASAKLVADANGNLSYHDGFRDPSLAAFGTFGRCTLDAWRLPRRRLLGRPERRHSDIDTSGTADQCPAIARGARNHCALLRRQSEPWWQGDIERRAARPGTSLEC